LFKDKKYQEITGIFFFLITVILFLSLVSFSVNDFKLLDQNRMVANIIGPLGATLSYYLRLTFGRAAYFILLIFGLLGWGFLKKELLGPILEKIFSLFFLTIFFSAFLAIFWEQNYFFGGGYLGFFLVSLFKSFLGKVGAYLVIIMMNLVGFILVGLLSLSSLASFRFQKNNWSVKKIPFLSKRKTQTTEENLPLNSIEADLAESLPPKTARTEEKKRLPWLIKKKIYAPEEPLEKQLADEANDNLRVPLEMLSSSDDSLIDSSPLESDIFKNNLKPEETFEDKESFEITAENEENVTKNELNNSFITPNRIKEIDLDETDFADSVFNKIALNKRYILPSNFFTNSNPVSSENWKSEIKKNSLLLVETLKDFGIEAKVTAVNRGPVITLYEIQIASGIKVNKVVGLSDDIAMALAALRVRIIAPIPGKSAIGVEIPNIEREKVTVGDVLKSKEYQQQGGALKVALGKDILGKPVMIDLKRLPHLLIAGATGSGKSVCVNAIITSILYKYDPNEVRFIMVDPKMVELQLYNGLPHLLTPVITDPVHAPNALKWAIYEMERRYKLLSSFNVRDLETYNKKINPKNDERLPYIITIIDELADLMMVSSKEIEGYITRIAQKARAVGIHLILATQRPSVDVITGIIKANFPARIAFQVAQKTDSRTILDQNGAEKLLGQGDMLYLSPASSFPVRLQGAYLSESEIEQVVFYLSKMGKPNYIDIEASIDKEEESKFSSEEGDDLFVEAIKIVEETKKASASYLQRRLSIGYNRAARIIEQMEDKGYIGPQQGSKPREVFI
jgi:S-DNA-T family DNA segregation ATPase FtsK/SpoIIIE